MVDGRGTRAIPLRLPADLDAIIAGLRNGPSPAGRMQRAADALRRGLRDRTGAPAPWRIEISGLPDSAAASVAERLAFSHAAWSAAAILVVAQFSGEAAAHAPAPRDAQPKDAAAAPAARPDGGVAVAHDAPAVDGPAAPQGTTLTPVDLLASASLHANGGAAQERAQPGAPLVQATASKPEAVVPDQQGVLRGDAHDADPSAAPTKSAPAAQGEPGAAAQVAQQVQAQAATGAPAKGEAAGWQPAASERVDAHAANQTAPAWRDATEAGPAAAAAEAQSRHAELILPAQAQAHLPDLAPAKAVVSLLSGNEDSLPEVAQAGRGKADRSDGMGTGGAKADRSEASEVVAAKAGLPEVAGVTGGLSDNALSASAKGGLPDDAIAAGVKGALPDVAVAAGVKGGLPDGAVAAGVKGGLPDVAVAAGVKGGLPDGAVAAGVKGGLPDVAVGADVKGGLPDTAVAAGVKGGAVDGGVAASVKGGLPEVALTADVKGEGSASTPAAAHAPGLAIDGAAPAGDAATAADHPAAAAPAASAMAVGHGPGLSAQAVPIAVDHTAIPTTPGDAAAAAPADATQHIQAAPLTVPVSDHPVAAVPADAPPIAALPAELHALVTLSVTETAASVLSPSTVATPAAGPDAAPSSAPAVPMPVEAPTLQQAAHSLESALPPVAIIAAPMQAAEPIPATAPLGDAEVQAAIALAPGHASPHGIGGVVASAALDAAATIPGHDHPGLGADLAPGLGHDAALTDAAAPGVDAAPGKASPGLGAPVPADTSSAKALAAGTVHGPGPDSLPPGLAGHAAGHDEAVAQDVATAGLIQVAAALDSAPAPAVPDPAPLLLLPAAADHAAVDIALPAGPETAAVDLALPAAHPGLPAAAIAHGAAAAHADHAWP